MRVATVLFLATLALGAYAEAPQRFNYQARLTDPSGIPLTGTHSCTFSIYSAPTGGTLLFTETASLSISDGVANHPVGSVQPLPLAIFSGASTLYLQVSVNGNPVLPRVAVESAPFAIHARSATTAATADEAVVAQGVADGSVTMDDLSPAVQSAVNNTGTFSMTLSSTPPPGYTFTGMTVQTSADGAWEGLAPMPTPCQLPSAAVVDSKVYLIGGYKPGAGTVSSVQMYDPATNTWTLRASMISARYGTGAAALNNKIYVFGGTGGGGVLNTTEVYDPATDTWALKAPMPTARAVPGCTTVGDRIYCLGGVVASSVHTAVNEEYNPATDSWTVRAPLPDARAAQATVSAGGKIYAIGGVLTGNVVIAANDEYDPALNSWSSKAPLGVARYYTGAAAHNGRIYLTGGVDGSSPPKLRTLNEEYDPVGNTWSSKAPVPSAVYSHAAAAVNGRLYTFGGADGGVTGTVREYNIGTNSWNGRAPMPTARYGLAAVGLNGKLYAIGGYNDVAYLPTNEEYDPVTNTWATRASMPTARAYLGAAAVSNRIYAVGGADATGEKNTNEQYNPVMDSWMARTAMPTARSGLGVASPINGMIYAVGGFTGTSPVATNEEYNPVGNNWTARPPMNNARGNLGLAAHDDRLYALGGTLDPATSPLTHNEIFYTATNTWSAAETALPEQRHGIAAVSDGTHVYMFGGEQNPGAVRPEVYIYNTSSRVWADKNDMPASRLFSSAVMLSGKIYLVGGKNGGGPLNSVDQYAPPLANSLTLYIHQRN